MCVCLRAVGQTSSSWENSGRVLRNLNVNGDNDHKRGTNIYRDHDSMLCVCVYMLACVCLCFFAFRAVLGCQCVFLVLVILLYNSQKHTPIK